MRKFLHVGCGQSRQGDLIGFASPDWQEVRLDINPEMEPDIVGTMTDMGNVPSASMDAVYSSHNVEHVFPHEVPSVLSEFHRVLRDDGFLVVTCPDLEAVCQFVVQRGLTEPLFTGPMGPITPMDALYGHVGAIAAGNEFMAHKGGFTIQTLAGSLQAAGFKTLHGGRRPQLFDLWLLAFKSETSDAQCREMAQTFLPH